MLARFRSSPSPLLHWGKGRAKGTKDVFDAAVTGMAAVTIRRQGAADERGHAAHPPGAGRFPARLGPRHPTGLRPWHRPSPVSHYAAHGPDGGSAIRGVGGLAARLLRHGGQPDTLLAGVA